MGMKHCIFMAVWLYISIVDCKVTVEQMEKSGAMIRSVCQPRIKITDEMANGIREGKFPDDKILKCYAHCVLEMSGIMKKNKLNYDAAIKQMDMLLPDDIVDENKNAITVCRDSGTYYRWGPVLNLEELNSLENDVTIFDTIAIHIRKFNFIIYSKYRAPMNRTVSKT